MTKEKEQTITPEVKKDVTQQKEVGLKDASVEQLEAFAFRISQQIKGLQSQYNTVYQELVSREEVNKK